MTLLHLLSSGITILIAMTQHLSMDHSRMNDFVTSLSAECRRLLEEEQAISRKREIAMTLLGFYLENKPSIGQYKLEIDDTMVHVVRAKPKDDDDTSGGGDTGESGPVSDTNGSAAERGTLSSQRSPERDAYMHANYEKGVVQSVMIAAMNAMPGMPFNTSVEFTRYATSLGLHRPEWYRAKRAEIARQNASVPITSKDGGFSAAAAIETAAMDTAQEERMTIEDARKWAQRAGLRSQAATIEEINALREHHHLPGYTIVPTRGAEAV